MVRAGILVPFIFSIVLGPLGMSVGIYSSNCAAASLSGLVFHDYNGNGLKDNGEPGTEGIIIFIGFINSNLSSTSDQNGFYNISNVPNGHNSVYIQNASSEAEESFKFINHFKQWVDIPAYEMNGVQVPSQHLADTEVTKLEDPIIVTVSNNTHYDIALMQGFLTLPFRIEEYDQYELANFCDLDVARNSVRTYQGTLPYSYYSDQHYGLDFNGPIGIFVVSVAPGEVYSTTIANNGAKSINSIHIDNMIVNLGHLDEFLVTTGKVLRGQIVGTNGDTGSPGIPHIHMGFYDGDVRDANNRPAAVDPFMDTVSSNYHFEEYSWTPSGVTQLISIGSPGFWTKCNNPQPRPKSSGNQNALPWLQLLLFND